MGSVVILLFGERVFTGSEADLDMGESFEVAMSKAKLADLVQPRIVSSPSMESQG